MPTSSLRTASLPAIAFFGVLFLFFFQLLNDFVEPIWAFWVEEGSISFEIIVLLLVFSPVVLIFLRSDPPAVLAFILAKVVLMSRVIEVLLDPRGSMFVSGLGVASFLLLFPLILWDLGRKQDKEAIAEMGIGLGIGLGALLVVPYARLRNRYHNRRLVAGDRVGFGHSGRGSLGAFGDCRRNQARCARTPVYAIRQQTSIQAHWLKHWLDVCAFPARLRLHLTAIA